MKKLSIVIIIYLTLVFNLLAQDKQQTETEKLSQEMATLFQQGKIENAIDVAEKIVKLEKKTSKTSFAYANSIVNLGVLQTEKLRRWKNSQIPIPTNAKEAVVIKKLIDEVNESAKNTADLFHEALEIYENNSENENSQVATIKSQLAWVSDNFFLVKPNSIQESRSRIDEAELLYTEAVGLQEKILGKNNELTLKTYIDFADFYLKYVNFEKALPFYETYRTEVEGKFGKESKLLLKCLRPMAKILAMNERQTELAEIIQQINKLSGNITETPTAFELSLRSKDSLTQKSRAFGLERPKYIKVNILIDENGKVVEAVAQTKEVSDKKEAETEVSRWNFRPFIYNNEVRKMRGIVYFLVKD
jgi:tetratricopeptide (TPR) repeat protein